MPKLVQNAWLDPQHLSASYSRAEREYIQEQDRLAQDDMTRHRVVLWCWDAERQGYFPREVWHPSDQDLIAIASELAPLWSRAHVSPACLCAEQHTALTMMRTRLLTTTSYLTVSRTGLRDAAKTLNLTKAQLRALRPLQNRVFVDEQQAADALVHTLPREDIELLGETLMRTLQPCGVDMGSRQQWLKDIDAALQPFAGAVPRKPERPTLELCPFCQQPYRHSLIEWLSSEQTTWQRVLDILVGAPLMAGEIKKLLAAVERWLFVMADTTGESKKKLTDITLTELLISDLIQWIRNVKAALIARRSDTTSSSAASTGTMPPPPIPPDNSTPSTANTSSAT